MFSKGNELVSSLPASLTLIRYRPEVPDLTTPPSCRAPVIETEPERVGSLGQDLILQCRTRSVSNRTRIVWLRDLQPLKISPERHSVVATFLEREQRSDLLIRWTSSYIIFSS